MRACLDPAGGAKVKLKEVWQGYIAQLHGDLCANLLASKACEPARNQRLLAIRAHEGPCAADLALAQPLLQKSPLYCVLALHILSCHRTLAVT